MIVGVFGATGFIGRHLVPMLEARGHSVVSYVRGPARHVQQVAVGDLGCIEWREPRKARLDAVVHLAADASMADEPRFSRQAQITERVLRIARRAGAGHFVYMSSIKANGENTASGLVFSEEDDPVPRTAYGRHKLDEENRVRRACLDAGMAYTIIRPPMVYGSGAGGNFSKLSRLALSGIPLPLGGIRNRRSMVYVKNLADFVGRTLESEASAGQLFLISDGEDVSTPELVKRIAAAAGAAVRLWPAPVPAIRLAGAILRRSELVSRLCDDLRVDASAAMRLVGWTPPFSLEDALRETMLSAKPLKDAA